MSEREWLAATDPNPMLFFLDCREKIRKLRLFAVHCCRRVQHACFEDETGSIALVDVAECNADEISGCGHHTTFPKPNYGSGKNFENAARQAVAMGPDPILGAITVASSAVLAIGTAAFVERTRRQGGHEAEAMTGAWKQEGAAQSDLLRDIFGNPFRPVAFAPDWRTGTVLSIATQMYESRDFSAMPILADALQDANCDHDDILSHCRGPKPHVRGCWVVDLILGKK